ncbi:MAG: 6-phosphogluconolactonase [Betaproteobacteria bacterium]
MVHRMARIQAFTNATALAEAMASIVLSALKPPLAQRDCASLVLSGGRTPLLFLSALAECEVHWRGVTVTLSDERWVDESDSRSNARLLREHLFRGPAAAARFVPLKNGAATPHEGVAAAEAALADIEDPYDLVVLGMGEDAHIASLFPGAAELQAGLDPSGRARCVGITPPPMVDPNVPRISLTPSELCKGRRIVLVIAGAEKLRVLNRALSATRFERTPVAALFESADKPIDVLWLENA